MAERKRQKEEKTAVKRSDNMSKKGKERLAYCDNRNTATVWNEMDV